MNDWKQAIWLTKFELKRSVLSYIIIAFILFFSIIFTTSLARTYFTEPTIALDITFLLIFSIFLQRPETSLFYTRLSSQATFSIPLIGLKHLAIKKEVIVKHRFLTFISFSLPFSILFFSAAYFIVYPLASEMSLTTYLVFSMMWICFNLYVGSGIVVFEAGAKLIHFVFFGIALYLLFLTYLIIFFKIYQYGLINWMIDLATNHPILSLISSILLAVIGVQFWMTSMLRKMQQFDYL